MTTGLRGVQAKIARSEYHLHGTAHEATGYPMHLGVFDLIHNHISEHFDGLVTQQDPETQQPVLPAHLCDLPLEVSVASGDVVHNLRSALDHLVWALVESNGKVPSDTTDFPILLDTPTATKANQPVLKLDGHVSSAALAEIERLQPYHAGHASLAAMTPLGMLRELSNVDKHRYLPLMVTSTGPATWVYPGNQSVQWTLKNYFDDGADFTPLDPNMSMQGHLVLQVTIPPSVPIGKNPPAFPKGDEPLYHTHERY